MISPSLGLIVSSVVHKFSLMDIVDLVSSAHKERVFKICEGP